MSDVRREREFGETSDEAIDIQAEMTNRMAELETMLNEVENTQAWKIMLKDINGLVEELDLCWQNQSDVDELRKMQVTKLGLLTVTNLREDWQNELDTLREDLATIENKDLV